MNVSLQDFILKCLKYFKISYPPAIAFKNELQELWIFYLSVITKPLIWLQYVTLYLQNIAIISATFSICTVDRV